MYKFHVSDIIYKTKIYSFMSRLYGYSLCSTLKELTIKKNLFYRENIACSTCVQSIPYKLYALHFKKSYS